MDMCRCQGALKPIWVQLLRVQFLPNVFFLNPQDALEIQIHYLLKREKIIRVPLVEASPCIEHSYTYLKPY